MDIYPSSLCFLQSHDNFLYVFSQAFHIKILVIKFRILLGSRIGSSKKKKDEKLKFSQFLFLCFKMLCYQILKKKKLGQTWFCIFWPQTYCSSHFKVTFTLCVMSIGISDTWILPFRRAWVKLKMSSKIHVTDKKVFLTPEC